jgi:hypothetical protein
MDTPRIAMATAMALMVIGAWSLGMSARNATISEMGTDRYNGCTIVGEEPTGPEPDVTIWHRIYNCDGTYVISEFYVDECGYTIEGEEMVPSSCTPMGELQERMGAIRDARMGARHWGTP